MNYIFGQKYHNIAGAYRYKDIGIFGLGISIWGDEGFKITSETGESETIVDTASWSINAGYCYEYRKDILIGGNWKYVREGYYIGDEGITSGGIGISGGILTKELFRKDLDLSFVIKNLGFKSEYEGGTESGIPFEIVLGGRYRLEYIKPVIYFVKGLNIGTDIVINNYGHSGVRAGCEGDIAGMPMGIKGYARLGLQVPSPVEGHFFSGVNTGIGLRWKEYGIDYAFNYSGASIGFVHYITLSMDLK